MEADPVGPRPRRMLDLRRPPRQRGRRFRPRRARSALGLEAGGIEKGSEIAELLVDPDFARSGHGSRLLQAIADTSGSATLRIWAGAEDEARLRFLQSAGFAPAGLRRCLEPEGGEPILQHLWWAALESGT